MTCLGQFDVTQTQRAAYSDALAILEESPFFVWWVGLRISREYK